MNSTLEQPVTKKKQTGFLLNPQNRNNLGRPLNPEKRQLENALRAVKRNHNNVEFLHHIADEAYKNNTVAMKVLDKLIPNAENPKQDENTGFKQLIIVRTSDTSNAISGQVCVQPEEVSGDVEQLGNREDDVIDIEGDAVQRTTQEQFGSNLSKRICRPEEQHD